MTDLVVIVPMLGRPHRVRPVLESFGATADCRVLFVCSPDDTPVRAEIAAAGGEHICVAKRFPRGDYAIKVNVAYRATSEPLLFLAADDLDPHPGWFDAATALLSDGVGVVGTNDLTNPRTANGAHSTHSLVTRAYADELGTIDEPGQVLHEGYWHEFVDDELVGTAKARGAFAHAADSHVEHLHPMGGKAPMDAMYRMQAKRMRVSRPLFERRRQLWTT